MRRLFATLFALSFITPVLFAQAPPSDIVGVHRLQGMDFIGRIARDSNGIINIVAFNRHDLYFLNGYAHAHDRLFQMDVSRRAAFGTLAELVGPSALPNDIQLRTIGLGRAAVASYQAYGQRAKEALTAYAAGVNEYLRTHTTLPPEYGPLEVTQIPQWRPEDSIAIGKLIAFSLSFDTNDTSATVALLTYQGIGAQAGFNGTALFFEDLFRSAPFNPASTVPDSRSTSSESDSAKTAGSEQLEAYARAASELHPALIDELNAYHERLAEAHFFNMFRLDESKPGSNEWGVTGARSQSGRPMIANDPHLSLSAPSTFTPIVLRAGRINVAGHGFAGTPGVILGHNARIAWGATTVGYDVTDYYQEQVVPDSQAPAGLSVVVNGQREWLFPILQTFRHNNLGNGTMNDLTTNAPSATIPQASLIVPSRNAPIVSLNVAQGIAVSVQYTGLNATRELETFLLWAEAENIDEFRDALQFFDFGAQNWAYTDVEGNVAYFTSGEIPIREDLQNNVITGLPPWFVRNGSQGNGWVRNLNPPPGQATPNAIIPFSEMPQVVNPPAGWFVNANNDPGGNTIDNDPLNEQRPGGGIFYYGRWFANGLRAGRITQMIRNELANGGRISFEEMQAMQGDVVMLDAQYFVPLISQALTNAQAPGASPPLTLFAPHLGVIEAVNRLRNWDFSTPTGIPEGYDYVDTATNLTQPSASEIANSVAATIYSVWRSRFIANTIDATLAAMAEQAGGINVPRPDNNLVLAALRNILENVPARGGAGASGVPFLNVPGVQNTVATGPLRRDFLLLFSLDQALMLLASDTFAPAFNRSVRQEDYRWGKLHRIVFRHTLNNDVFNIPTAGGAWPHPLGAALPGIPTDGGYEVVDASSHSPRAAGVNSFMFGSGPARRFVAEGQSDEIEAETSTPGGPSGVVGSPLYFNLLRMWLANDYYESELARGPNIPFVRN